jgi:hypothetical protein
LFFSAKQSLQYWSCENFVEPLGHAITSPKTQGIEQTFVAAEQAAQEFKRITLCDRNAARRANPEQLMVARYFSRCQFSGAQLRKMHVSRVVKIL